MFQNIDLKVKDLKNGMSSFCHEHIFELFNDKNFQVHYKSFKNDYLTAWQTQTIFQDIIKFYKNAYEKLIDNLNLGVQDKIEIKYYKKDGKHYKKGDLKSFKIIKKQTNLTRLIKYLVFVDDINKSNDEIKGLYDYFKQKGFEDRILRLVQSIKNRLKSKVKKIEFTTGTYRVCYSNSEGGHDI